MAGVATCARCGGLYQSSHYPLEMSEGVTLSTAPEIIETCTHERRPGTTVCLRCRHAARAAARERFKRLMLRGSAVAIVVATFDKPEPHVAALTALGVPRDRVVTLRQ